MGLREHRVSNQFQLLISVDHFPGAPAAPGVRKPSQQAGGMMRHGFFVKKTENAGRKPLKNTQKC